MPGIISRREKPTQRARYFIARKRDAYEAARQDWQLSNMILGMMVSRDRVASILKVLMMNSTVTGSMTKTAMIPHLSNR